MSSLFRFPTVLLAMMLGASPAVGNEAPAARRANGFVTAQGRQLIAPNGQILHLKGINLGGWLVPEGYMLGFSSAVAPWQIRQVFKELVGTQGDTSFWRRWYDTFITRDDIRYIRATGMNVVRVPFDYRLFSPEEYPGTWVRTGFELLDRVIEWSREAGLFVLLDMHAAPCGQNALNVDYGFPHLYESRACLSRTAEIWRRIARHYARNRTVIGYDLLNEPAPAQGKDGQPALDAANEKIAATIERVDRNHLLFVTSVRPDADSTIFAAKRFRSKLVYTFHSYWAEPTDGSFLQHIRFAERYDVPIYLGESGENTDDWIQRFRLALERHDIGWTFWTYKRMDARASMRRFDKPVFWDELVAYQATPTDPFAETKKATPSAARVHAALVGLLHNCRFENTHENTGYLEALGMAPRRRP